MKLIIGLGNPGKEYKNTRHNLGAQIISKYLDEKHQAIPRLKSKLSSDIYEVGQGTDKKIFAIPTQWMNNSGLTVKKLVDFYKIDPQNLYIIHDDLDLDIGDYKIQFNRGSAGHNGIKSVIQHLNTQEFNRIRVGIGKDEKQTTEDYVLKNFSSIEKRNLDKVISKIIEELDNI